MPKKSIKIDTALRKAGVAAAAVILGASAWFVAKWCIASSALERADNTELAVYLTRLAPDDPRTHYVAAQLFEKNFDSADFEKALIEYEIAAGLSPENYILWLDLGRARERSGDAGSAELVFRRALSLAPNYARVQWMVGNALLRQGRVEEAFGHIGKAVAGDKAFAVPAANSAWQFFDGDVAAIRRATGDSIAFDGALAGLLARENRFEEAIAIWDSLPSAEKKLSLKDTGTALLAKLLEAKNFRYAVRVSASLVDGAETPGTITNGGFELAVKPDGAGQFEWQIASGVQPQIVLNNSQKHGGSNSLLLIFNSTDGKDFRTISQTVALEPGKDHEVALFYRADLKTNATFRWEIADTADGKSMATTGPITVKADWTPLAVKFRTGPATDGVILRLVRESCTAVCPVTGNLWFDDFSLRTAQ